VARKLRPTRFGFSIVVLYMNHAK